MAENYCISSPYRVNAHPKHYVDLNEKDRWQDEVYQYAHTQMTSSQSSSIVDVGCGSGYKLMKYFRAFETVGYETEPCLSFLRRTYPDRTWVASGESEKSFPVQQITQCDIVICSDVIEHIVDPDSLIRFLLSLEWKWLILSTPDREVLRGMKQYGEKAWTGPPVNPAHVREWTFQEFSTYLSKHFEIVDGRHCVKQKECMLFLCKKKTLS